MLDAAVVARTAPLYERVKAVIPSIEWPFFAEDIDAILELKRQRKAIVLAHNYQTPEIFHCIANIVGDSLALARAAMRFHHWPSFDESKVGSCARCP